MPRGDAVDRGDGALMQLPRYASRRGSGLTTPSLRA
jgi:hypothetical protein